jgi:hypothetical protein
VFATLNYGPGSVDFHGTGSVAAGLVLTNLDGIGQAPIRAPIDDMPQADGGIVHQFFYGPRHLTVEGTVFPFGYDSSHQATMWSTMDGLQAALGAIQWPTASFSIPPGRPATRPLSAAMCRSRSRGRSRKPSFWFGGRRPDRSGLPEWPSICCSKRRHLLLEDALCPAAGNPGIVPATPATAGGSC